MKEGKMTSNRINTRKREMREKRSVFFNVPIKYTVHRSS
jgi:hypothetical protein